MNPSRGIFSVAAAYDRRTFSIAVAAFATRIGCTPALGIAKRLQNKCDGHRPPLQTLALICFALIFFFSSASALTEENVNITRDAKSGGKLVVDVEFGTIDVAPGDNDKVVVNASRKISASSKDKEAE